MAFTEATLEEIRRRTDLIEVASEYTVLKKTGQNFSGLCPLHSEKSGSFFIQPDRQIFKCFGCQKGGNVFKFIQEVEGLSFPETVRMLAKRCGVEIVEEERFSRKTEVPNTPKKTLEALQWAAKYYHYLLNENESYGFAREYLKKRGISQKTIDKFQIGVSPRSWTTLMSLMLKRGFTTTELIEAGLVIPKEKSPSDGYDRFRERLMFPITNRDGDVVGFGARQLVEEKDQPKYINSPDSDFFPKRKILYGLFENQRAIRLRGEVVVVEGYMDVVGLFEHGVTNAVATMGTALSSDHCETLRSLTPRVVTVFDPDEAGEEAWRRSVHLFLENRIFAKDLSLPGGKDPDEFVAAEGAEKFYKLCETAPRQVTKYLREIVAKGPLSEEQTSKHVKDLMPILHSSRNNPDRATLWDDISMVLKVKVPTLQAMVESYRGGGDHKAAPTPAPKRPTIPAKKSKLHPLDSEFLRASVRAPKPFLSWPKEAWEGTLHDKTIESWLTELHDCKTLEAFEDKLTSLSHNQEHPELAALAASGLFTGSDVAGSQAATEFTAVAERLRQLKKELEIKSLSTQVKLTQRMGDQVEQLKLLEKLRQLRTT